MMAHTKQLNLLHVLRSLSIKYQYFPKDKFYFLCIIFFHNSSISEYPVIVGDNHGREIVGIAILLLGGGIHQKDAFQYMST